MAPQAQKNVAHKKAVHPFITAEPVDVVVIPEKDSLSLVQIETPPPLLAEEPQKKKRKNRYVQIDFSDPVQEVIQEPIYVKGFKIELLGNGKLPPTNTQTTSSSYFKINF